MTRDVTLELKALRLHGMAGAWTDLVEQGGNAGIESSRWLIEHLLQAEGVERLRWVQRREPTPRSVVRYQPNRGLR